MLQWPRRRWAIAAAGAAGVGLVVTLVIFVVVFLAFLIAPLLALAAAFLGYTVMRPRANRTESTGPSAAPGEAAHGFGAGAQ